MKTMWSPPGWRANWRHSNQAQQPGRSGTPSLAFGEGEAANLSSPRLAKRWESPADRRREDVDRVTAAFRRSGTLGRCPDRLHTTSGGASETELNELTVRPTGSPLGARAVITVTPVETCPACRERRAAGSFLKQSDDEMNGRPQRRAGKPVWGRKLSPPAAQRREEAL